MFHGLFLLLTYRVFADFVAARKTKEIDISPNDENEGESDYSCEEESGEELLEKARKQLRAVLRTLPIEAFQSSRCMYMLRLTLVKLQISLPLELQYHVLQHMSPWEDLVSSLMLDRVEVQWYELRDFECDTRLFLPGRPHWLFMKYSFHSRCRATFLERFSSMEMFLGSANEGKREEFGNVPVCIVCRCDDQEMNDRLDHYVFSKPLKVLKEFCFGRNCSIPLTKMAEIFYVVSGLCLHPGEEDEWVLEQCKFEEKWKDAIIQPDDAISLPGNSINIGYKEFDNDVPIW